jgi:hypothetical protein
MISRLIGLMILGLVSGPALAQAGDIYRWTDEEGRVTYGNLVPDRYKRVARRVDTGLYDVVDMRGAAGAAGEKTQVDSPAAPSSATGSGRPAGAKPGAAGN